MRAQTTLGSVESLRCLYQNKGRKGTWTWKNNRHGTPCRCIPQQSPGKRGCDRRSASSRGAPVTSTAPEDGTTKHHPGPPCDSILIQSCLIPPIRSVASRPRRYDPKGSAGSTPRRGRSRGPGRGADWRGPDPAAVFGQAQYIPRPPMVVVHPERNPFRNELGSNRCPGFDLVPVASECCAFSRSRTIRFGNLHAKRKIKERGPGILTKRPRTKDPEWVFHATRKTEKRAECWKIPKNTQDPAHSLKR